MRLLFISSFYLFQGTRFGGSKRLYYFAKEWEKTSALSLICMDGCREWTGVSEGDTGFRDFLMVPGAEAPGWRGRILHAPSDRTAFLEPMRGEIRRFLEGKRFDAILLAYPWSLSFLGGMLEGVLDGAFEGAPEGIKTPVFFLEDDLVLEQYKAAAEHAGNPVSRFLKRFRYRQTMSYFRKRMAKVGYFIGISPQETALVRTAFPGLGYAVIKYGLPLEEFPFLPPSANPGVIGFIGNYDHVPNMDALAWLDREVIPAIRARCPNARFVIAGRGLPGWYLAKHSANAWMTFRENVKDLKEFYGEIALFINPVRTGRGLRTKLIEAAAYGRPILSTTLGAEGLEDLRIDIADSAESFALQCERLLADPNGVRTTRANRAVIEGKYSLSVVAGKFLDILSKGGNAPDDPGSGRMA